MAAVTDMLMEDKGPAPIVRVPAARKPQPVAQPSLGQIVDVPYTLWLVTVATALMAALSLILTLTIYMLDNVLSLSGGAPIFTPGDYRSVLELSVIFALLSIAAHFLRLRLEASRNAAVIIPLPFRIAIEPPMGDLTSRFEASCNVAIAFDREEPIRVLTSQPDVLKRALENAFIIAVTDPVIRFSKQKMEQTLKMAAVGVLGQGVAFLDMSEVRQRRLPPRPPSVDATGKDTVRPSPTC
ncbi:hypothetical protein SAMN05660686_01692 [Thalassobaculum litoreum DSM 18839]|uniref:Uncharacterized protein n=1 Tax=Thalassobaculum litoreum DSM 18839 TaxID=1123362 RepID=A0A8G2BJ67_9PROT|nr:hypothetical protein SAMN05660686_01692 [Thalassobaculum litoreum DSM 18839]